MPPSCLDRSRPVRQAAPSLPSNHAFTFNTPGRNDECENGLQASPLARLTQSACRALRNDTSSPSPRGAFSSILAGIYIQRYRREHHSRDFRLPNCSLNIAPSACAHPTPVGQVDNIAMNDIHNEVKVSRNLLRIVGPALYVYMGEMIIQMRGTFRQRGIWGMWEGRSDGGKLLSLCMRASESD